MAVVAHAGIPVLEVPAQDDSSLEPKWLLRLSLAGSGPPGSAACFKLRKPFDVALASENVLLSRL